LATVSRKLLLAVAADDAEAACARATALARGVLESPVVALASAVLRGGPLEETMHGRVRRLSAEETRRYIETGELQERVELWLDSYDSRHAT
jgi:hypothetical protein